MTPATTSSQTQEILRSLGIEDTNKGAFCGRWLDTQGPLIESVDPATGQVLASVRSATAEDYEEVAAAAPAAVTATVLGAGMRWLAAALAAAAWVPAAWGLDPSATTTTLIGTGVALAALSAALTLHGLRPGAVWLAPVAFYAAATQVLAALAALSVLPDDDLVIVVLLAVVRPSIFSIWRLWARRRRRRFGSCWWGPPCA